MSARKQIPTNEKLPLTLAAAERKLVLELLCLDDEYVRLIRDSSSGHPVMMTLDELDDFGGYIAAEANHCGGKKQKSLDTVFGKIQKLLETHTDEPQTISLLDARQSNVVADQAVRIAEWTAEALVAAEQTGIKHRRLPHFQLAPAQREVLLLVPGVTTEIKAKLTKSKSFTVAEVASMVLALAEDLTGDTRKQVAVLLVARDLVDQLQAGLADSGKPKRRAKVDKSIYQFKITLLGIQPPIWRRIQVQDCTLDRLHEYIQTAMGWTNSHLHQFEIEGTRYGNPELFDDDYDCVDSTKSLLSAILPEPVSFCYEYDFGDGWEHEIRFEGRPPSEQGKKYPICLEGERACPPEDCGGVWGYQDFLAAIADPKHEEHQSLLEWYGAAFSDEFDPVKATRRMKKGLPNWRTS